jgi:hypothetical protein
MTGARMGYVEQTRVGVHLHQRVGACAKVALALRVEQLEPAVVAARDVGTPCPKEYSFPVEAKTEDV